MPNNTLLAIDTATEALSIALWVNGESLEFFELAPRRHAAEILPQIQRLLASAELSMGQLDALAVGTGPGSFTGVRIGIALTQGLAMGAGLGVFPVSSLKAMGHGVYQETGHAQVVSVFDARMGQIYAGAYAFAADGGPQLPDCVCDPEDLRLPASGAWAFAGSGLGAYADTLAPRYREQAAGWLPDRYPAARDVCALARSMKDSQKVAAEDLAPTYIRNQVTHSAAQQKDRTQPKD